MTTVDVDDRLRDGMTALLAGQWEAARLALESVVDTSDDPVATIPRTASRSVSGGVGSGT